MGPEQASEVANEDQTNDNNCYDDYDDREVQYENRQLPRRTECVIKPPERLKSLLEIGGNMRTLYIHTQVKFLKNLKHLRKP